jgi:hypothetical protein
MCAAARGAPVVVEPAQAVVGGSAVVRLADDRIALVVPSGKQKHLLISRDAHPITLQDFAEPFVLFGEGGALGAEGGERVAIAKSGNDVHVICDSARRMNWYTAAEPISRDSKWRNVSQELAGNVEVDQAIVTQGDARGDAYVLYRETTEKQRFALGVATLRDGKLATLRVAESDDEFLWSARGSRGSDGALDIVWTESELMPVVMQARLDPASGKVSERKRIGNGTYPDVLRVGQRTFVASEQGDGSIRAEWWDAADGSRQSQQLRGRGGFRPTLVADEHGVVWLFSIGLDQRGVYYRRFQGSGFCDEYAC